MRCFRMLSVFLCGVLAAGALTAGTTNELSALQASRAAEDLRIDTAQEQQKTNAFAVYRKAVDALMVTVKKQGNLDSYLVLETEKKRLASENTINTNEVPVLAPLVAQYQKNLQDATSAHDKDMATLLRLYVGRLTSLMQKYTRANRLDDAKLVRDELQEAKTELTFLEADAPAEAAQPPPATPATRPPAADDPAKAIPGTWAFTWRDFNRSGTDTIVFEADGTASNQKDGTTGTWELKERQCLIHWPATDHTMTLSSNGKHMIGHNRLGVSISAAKTNP